MHVGEPRGGVADVAGEALAVVIVGGGGAIDLAVRREGFSPDNVAVLV